MPFTPSALERIATPDTMSRGREYAEAGRVSDLAFAYPSSTQLRVTGTVTGATRYRASMEVNLAGDHVTYEQCTCPYDWGGACKHIVALGLAAIAELARGAVQAPARPEMTSILEEFFRERGLDVKGPEAAALAAKLSGAGVSVGADGVQARPKPRRHATYELDELGVELTYDHLADTLFILPTVSYGPRHLMAGDHGADLEGESMVGKSVTAWRIDRDWASEMRFVRELSDEILSPADRQGRFALEGGPAIYEFLKHTLPRLERRHPIRVHEDAKRFFDGDDMKSGDVESEWRTSISETGYLDFSVEWHLAGAGITRDQLARMVERGDEYVRLNDGSFVEPANLEELRRELEVVGDAKKRADGTGALPLERAPELLELLSHGSLRKLEMDARVRSFLNETQAGRPIEPVPLPASLEDVLRPYQKNGVAWGMFLRKHGFGGVLADEMGLGKTLQVLALLSVREGLGTAKARAAGATTERGADWRPSIVVCPKTLLGTWEQEAQRFTPWLKTVVVDGAANERAVLLDAAAHADLVITSYPRALRDAEHYAARGLRFDYCILDEAQYVKNGDTGTAKAVKRIDARHRLALSGTPLENGVHELWSIFDFLMPGLLGDRREFRARYERPIHEKQDKAALERLQGKIRPFMLRRTKASEIKELPPKIEQVRECPLTPAQIVVYQRTLEQAKREVYDAVELKGFKRARIEILAALLRLRQACDHPFLASKQGSRDPELAGKMPHALEIIDEARLGGGKVLLFSAFTGMLDIVREALDARGVGHVTIEGKTVDRKGAVKKFSDDPNVQVFLLSLKAGGVGLTLTAADTVIMFDPWWNPMAESQAMDRAHRIGQTKTVNVHKLVTKGTIEERVVALQAKKRAIFEALMTENGDGLEAMTWEDVRGLFE